MKTLALLFLSVACLGQQSPVMTTPWVPPDHPARAEARPMLPEQTLLGSGYTMGTGEQSLSDSYRPTEVSLGARAKLCREEPKDNRCIYKGDK